MGWLSIFKPKTEAGLPAGGSVASPDSVARARTRARQRLIGAIVLVVIGVIGFPLVFETRPRPIPVDIAIEIPRKENAPPLRVPPAPPSASGTLATAAPARDEMVTETPADAGRDLVPAPTLAPAVPAAAPAPSSAPAARVAPPAPVPPAKPALTAEKPASASPEGNRAKALLEGAEPGAKGAGRFVVQVGAFADASAASELRGKVEKLGLKTYTQVAETPAGKRIRVRVGPFASRDEADHALAKARAAGVSGNVLTL